MLTRRASLRFLLRVGSRVKVIIRFLNKFKMYFINISWMMGEKVLSLLISFGVSIFLARNLGPEQFGVYSYALSVSTLFAVLAQFGLYGIVVRDLSKNIEKSGEIIASTICIKVVGVVIALILYFTYLITFESNDPAEFYALIAMMGVIVFTPFDGLDYWFQSQVKYRPVMISRTTSILLGSGLKIIVVLLGFSLTWVAISHSFTLFVFSVLILIFYLRASNGYGYSYRVNVKKVKGYLSEGFLVYLGTFFAVIYMKVDQVMLRWLSDSESVGIYSVAAQLSEAWYFIPAAIVATIFPKLVLLRDESLIKFNKSFQSVLNLLFVFALLVAIFTTIFSGYLIDNLYGHEYSQSAIVLNIHIWAGLFIFMRTAFSRWIIIEKLYVFSLLTQGMGALVNIILNFIFIPKYGVEGAAYSTLISYAVASYLSLAFYSKTRGVFVMMSKSLVSPAKYFMYLLNNKFKTRVY